MTELFFKFCDHFFCFLHSDDIMHSDVSLEIILEIQDFPAVNGRNMFQRQFLLLVVKECF